MTLHGEVFNIGVGEAMLSEELSEVEAAVEGSRHREIGPMKKKRVSWIQIQILQH